MSIWGDEERNKRSRMLNARRGALYSAAEQPSGMRLSVHLGAEVRTDPQRGAARLAGSCLGPSRFAVLERLDAARVHWWAPRSVASRMSAWNAGSVQGMHEETATGCAESLGDSMLVER